MRVQIPDAGDKFEASRMRQLVEAIRRAFVPAVSSTEAAPSILLQAPDGSVWRVTVNSLGVLSVTAA